MLSKLIVLLYMTDILNVHYKTLNPYSQSHELFNCYHNFFNRTLIHIYL